MDMAVGHTSWTSGNHFRRRMAQKRRKKRRRKEEERKKKKKMVNRFKNVLPLLKPTQSPKCPPKDGKCLFDSLPDEIVLKIFGFLNTPDIGYVSMTCRRFKILGADCFVSQHHNNKINKYYF